MIRQLEGRIYIGCDSCRRVIKSYIISELTSLTMDELEGLKFLCNGNIVQYCGRKACGSGLWETDND